MMNEHVKRTMDVVVERIAKLQDLLQGLRELESGADVPHGTTCVVPLGEKSAVKNGAVKEAVKVKRTWTRTAKSAAGTTLIAALRGVISFMDKGTVLTRSEVMKRVAWKHPELRGRDANFATVCRKLVDEGLLKRQPGLGKRKVFVTTGGCAQEAQTYARKGLEAEASGPRPDASPAKFQIQAGGKLTAVIGAWGPERVFTRADLAAELKKRLPDWDEHQERAAAQNLTDMTGRGEVIRKGFGRMAEYRRGVLRAGKAGPRPQSGPALPEPSAKEREYQALRGEMNISVPRDADVEPVA